MNGKYYKLSTWRTSCWNRSSPRRWCSLTLPLCHVCSSCRWWANTYTLHNSNYNFIVILPVLNIS